MGFRIISNRNGCLKRINNLLIYWRRFLGRWFFGRYNIGFSGFFISCNGLIIDFNGLLIGCNRLFTDISRLLNFNMLLTRFLRFLSYFRRQFTHVRRRLILLLLFEFRHWTVIIRIRLDTLLHRHRQFTTLVNKRIVILVLLMRDMHAIQLPLHTPATS